MRRLPLAQIRLRYVVEGRPLDGPTEAALRSDSRAGARAILDAIDKRRFDNRSEGQRLRGLLRFEAALWGTGVERVAGVDEAGMSPMAGPVAAAAVIFRPGSRIPGVDDSKKLDAAERDRLAVEIRSKALAYSVAFADVEHLLGRHPCNAARSGRPHAAAPAFAYRCAAHPRCRHSAATPREG